MPLPELCPCYPLIDADQQSDAKERDVYQVQRFRAQGLVLTAQILGAPPISKCLGARRVAHPSAYEG
jgi:hypothetical protein